MKATLEFNLPEDKEDFNLATNGKKWWYVSLKMDEWLRRKIKYPSDEASEEEIAAFEQAREKLYELMNENKVSLDDVS